MRNLAATLLLLLAAPALATHEVNPGAGGGGSGTVTSVGLTVPGGLSVSGSPVTGTGTLAVTGILAASAGGTGVSSAAVFPTSGTVDTTGATATLTNKTIDGTSNTLTVRAASDITGTLPIANGGTNSNAALTTGYIMVASGGAVVMAKETGSGAGMITPNVSIGAPASSAATFLVNSRGHISGEIFENDTNNDSLGFIVQGLADNDSSIFLKNTGGGHLWDVRSNHNGFFEWVDGTAGAQRMVIATNGGIGLGTQTPLSELDVRGSAAIGTYAGTQAGPTNGLIVSGNVGIGVTGPAVALDVGSGTVKADTATISTLKVNSNDGTHYVQMTAPATMSGNAAFNLPATSGTVGNVLTSGGGGGPMTWGSGGVSQATLNTTMEQQTSHRKANIVCDSDTTLNGSQTCDGVSTQASEVVAVLGNADPTEDCLYLENDFGPWAKTSDCSGVGDLRASVIAVDAQGGGTAYSNALIFTYGDGGTTQVIDRVPHGCARQSNACTAATTCSVTCSTAVNAPIMTGGGCQSTVAVSDSYPSADTTWKCDEASSGNITAYAICCN